MANDLSVRFVDYLRQNNHLAPIDGVVERTGPGADVRQLKLWEVTSLSPTEFADEAARFFALGRLALQDMTSAEPLVSAFSARFLRETMVYPCRAADGTTVLAVVDPTDQATLRAAQIVLGAGIDVKVASSEDVVIALNNASAEEAEATDTTSALPREDDIESLRDLASGAPVVRAVNDLIEKAVELRASDIHIEPFSAGLMVRLRIDGLLRPVAALSGVLPQAVVSRIKIIANLNIAERRLPQDGAARLRAGRTDIDIRVAIMPTQHGESAVIRILPKDRGLLVVEKLGFSAPDEGKLRRLLKLPHGMVVITGPTGSGKTTTLATILSILNEPSRKILTIEDPVEYELPGVNQSQIKPAIGLTFATALRSFVRQDPDVIMVGEIRDTETAHVAVHAALTGHLVLTTLHTNTAAGAVTRLIDMGIESFLLASCARVIVAQRLVRILCDHCKEPHTLSAADIAADERYAALGIEAGEVICRPKGCDWCGSTGFRGRKGVFEIMEIGPALRRSIGPKTDASDLEAVARRAGMTSMTEDGVAKIRAGQTTLDEIFRLTMSL